MLYVQQNAIRFTDIPFIRSISYYAVTFKKRFSDFSKEKAHIISESDFYKIKLVFKPFYDIDQVLGFQSRSCRIVVGMNANESGCVQKILIQKSLTLVSSSFSTSRGVTEPGTKNAHIACKYKKDSHQKH